MMKTRRTELQKNNVWKWSMKTLQEKQRKPSQGPPQKKKKKKLF